MGISNRDYARNTPPPGYHGSGGYGGTSEEWALKFLLIANIIVYFFQSATAYGSGPDVTGMFELLPSAVLQDFQIWRLVTCSFLHSTQGITHILFNMWALWMFGRLLEPIYGSKEFLAFYLVGVVLSSMGHLAMQVGLGSNIPAVGASGGVMTVVFIAAMTYPHDKVLLFFVIPMEFRYLAIIIALMDLFGLVHGGGNVAHAAHLAGAGFGVAYKSARWNLTGFFTGRQRPKTPKVKRSKAKVKLYAPEESDSPKNLDAEVERILEKISREGKDSLTKKEQKTMEAASQKYKARQNDQ